MAKYQNFEITIDEINEYKNNYELVVSNFLIKKEKINNLKEEFNIIKDLYNLEDDDFHYLNRIIIDKQKIKIHNINNNNNYCYCCIIIILLLLYHQ
jgi:hypothetical protein